MYGIPLNAEIGTFLEKCRNMKILMELTVAN